MTSFPSDRSKAVLLCMYVGSFICFKAEILKLIYTPVNPSFTV